MIEPCILYRVKCDRCGCALVDDNDFGAWYDYATAEDEALSSDWHFEGVKCYCPDCCYTGADGDRLVKKPYPPYVRKIHKFMTQIAISYPSRVVDEDGCYVIYGDTQDGKVLVARDEAWVRSYAGDKLIDIQIVDRGYRNAEYVIRLSKE